jgi:hypothetical protein
MATSMSASSNTTNGALPPSSIEHLTMFSAACARSTRPVSVEPVNDSLRTRGSLRSVPTMSDERRDGMTFTTPFGTPASSKICAMARAVSGVSFAGLRIMVQPAASAGPILRVAMAAGKFHGVTKSDTPMGWRSTMMRFAPPGAVEISPMTRTASSENQRRNSAA